MPQLNRLRGDRSISANVVPECPRTSLPHRKMSAFDPKRTSHSMRKCPPFDASLSIRKLLQFCCRFSAPNDSDGVFLQRQDRTFKGYRSPLARLSPQQFPTDQMTLHWMRGALSLKMMTPVIIRGLRRAVHFSFIVGSKTKEMIYR